MDIIGTWYQKRFRWEYTYLEISVKSYCPVWNLKNLMLLKIFAPFFPRQQFSHLEYNERMNEVHIYITVETCTFSKKTWKIMNMEFLSEKVKNSLVCICRICFFFHASSFHISKWKNECVIELHVHSIEWKGKKSCEKVKNSVCIAECKSCFLCGKRVRTFKWLFFCECE